MTYKIQIDDLVRDATAAETKALDEAIKKRAAAEAEEQSKATAKAALLQRLGITEEEAILLLG
jgi:hypothetical protein